MYRTARRQAQPILSRYRWRQHYAVCVTRPMIIRLLASLWLITTLWSLRLGVTALASASTNDVATRLTAFSERVDRLKKWPSRLAVVLAIVLFQRFFADAVNTSLWPWCSAAWAALFVQLLFVRPHMGGYVEIVQRGFKRPVEQFLVLHVVLDLVIIVPLVALVLSGPG